MSSNMESWQGGGDILICLSPYSDNVAFDKIDPTILLAEGVGFEPTERLRIHRFSRPAP